MCGSISGSLFYKPLPSNAFLLNTKPLEECFAIDEDPRSFNPEGVGSGMPCRNILTQPNPDMACRLSAANMVLSACHVPTPTEGQRWSRIIHLVSTEVKKAAVQWEVWLVVGEECSSGLERAERSFPHMQEVIAARPE